jgi:hypothetical protein
MIQLVPSLLVTYLEWYASFRWFIFLLLPLAYDSFHTNVFCTPSSEKASEAAIIQKKTRTSEPLPAIPCMLQLHGLSLAIPE